MDTKAYNSLSKQIIHDMKQYRRGLYVNYPNIPSTQLKLIFLRVVTSDIINSSLDVFKARRKSLTIRKKILNQEKRLILQGKPELLGF